MKDVFHNYTISKKADFFENIFIIEKFNVIYLVGSRVLLDLLHLFQALFEVCLLYFD
jgi:hypothetical protein